MRRILHSTIIVEQQYITWIMERGLDLIFSKLSRFFCSSAIISEKLISTSFEPELKQNWSKIQFSLEFFADGYI